MDGNQLRHRIYGHFAATGEAPSTDLVGRWVGDERTARAQLTGLHQQHLLVLDEAGEIRMALPFSAVDTGHRVVSGNRSWQANCAWDALAIPIVLGVDAVIDATWIDTGQPVDLSVVDGRLSGSDGWVHFSVPARHWWDDIVET